jgi:Domain of unknown function (DUF4326)
MTGRVVHCNDLVPGVYIGRPGIYGNPHKMHSEADRASVIEQFRTYLRDRCDGDPIFREAILRLKGKTLRCWCAPKACHGDVIVQWLEEHDA